MTIEQITYRNMYACPDTWHVFIDKTLPLLAELEPGPTTDGTSGFIAYNVPGKDRMKMKTGRFLTRKLVLNNGLLPDTVIQAMAAEINEFLYPDMAAIRLDTGDDITENYRAEIGGDSCMTGSSAECTGLYASNPDRFQQIVAQFGNDSARAIVHELDDGRYYMDRIYSTCEYLRDKLDDYADQQDWLRRSSDCGVPHGLTVSGLVYTDGEVPYMDSLCYYTIVNGLLTISSNSTIGCMGTLDTTDGCIGPQHVCTNCGYHVDGDDYASDDDGEIYCSDCYCEIFGCCECCGETCLRDNMVHVEDADIFVCDYCASAHYTTCENCRDLFKTTLAIGDDEYCEQCAKQCPICEDCNETVLEVNEDGYCEDCAPDHEDEIPCAAETGSLWND